MKTYVLLVVAAIVAEELFAAGQTRIGKPLFLSDLTETNGLVRAELAPYARMSYVTTNDVRGIMLENDQGNYLGLLTPTNPAAPSVSIGDFTVYTAPTVDRMITLKADKVKTVVTTTILDGEAVVETNYYPTVYLDDIAPFTAATNKIEMARRAIENADLSTVSGLSAALEAVKNTLGE